ncbi:MAG: rhodanese domain-containing protein [Rhodocyclaceae bacterium]|nr:MAG: rhodanese domain-containing protein [Rhodocyclaceae bacterium]
MSIKLLRAGLLALVVLSAPAIADNREEAVKAMEEYLDFVDYGGATMFPEQIPREDWKRFHIIDARDKDQYAKEHIPGAVNLEWRQVIAQRQSIPKDKPVLIYCNTGSLSAQAGFALRLAGYDNVRILQGGFAEWKAKGGLDAASKATSAAKH